MSSANVTLDNITDVVIAAMSPDIPKRNREIMESLIRHLHAFAKEVKLTHKEWLAACELCVALAISRMRSATSLS